MQQTRQSIRNIDPAIWIEARIHALQTGECMGELINRSLELLLSEETDDEEVEQLEE